MLDLSKRYVAWAAARRVYHSAHGREHRTACGVPIAHMWGLASEPPDDIRMCRRCAAMARDLARILEGST